MRLALAIVTLAATDLFAALPGPYVSAAAPFPYDGPYSRPAEMAGSTAVPYHNGAQDARILGWASEVTNFTRGKVNISNPSVTVEEPWGSPSDALGPADAYGSENFSVVSLLDGGSITLKFPEPIGNGPGPDLAVFENAFDDNFLELAFVEVSSNGTTFHRFPAVSLTQTDTQISGYGLLDTTYIHNLAGKFRSGFGTPFDLADLAGIPDLDISMITHARIIDVVGSVNPLWGQLDSQGHLVNDPWTTAWETGGFDLDAVAYMNVAIPEPSAALVLGAGAVVASTQRRRRHR